MLLPLYCVCLCIFHPSWSRFVLFIRRARSTSERVESSAEIPDAGGAFERSQHHVFIKKRERVIKMLVNPPDRKTDQPCTYFPSSFRLECHFFKKTFLHFVLLEKSFLHDDQEIPFDVYVVEAVPKFYTKWLRGSARELRLEIFHHTFINEDWVSTFNFHHITHVQVSENVTNDTQR